MCSYKRMCNHFISGGCPYKMQYETIGTTPSLLGPPTPSPMQSINLSQHFHFADLGIYHMDLHRYIPPCCIQKKKKLKTSSVC